jgi:spore coat protein A, manganese oxidase
MNRFFKTFLGVALVSAGFLFTTASDVSGQRIRGRGERMPRLRFAVNKLRIAMDYDHDGTADYVVFNPATNTWRIIKSLGGTVNTPFGFRSTDYFTPGDFDGDGTGDLAVFRDTEHKWYVMQSSTATTVVTDFGATGDEPVARDYDGDGKTDFAVVHTATGIKTWTIKSSLTGTTSSTAWGVAADATAPGDYDGDGKFDLAVKRAGRTATTIATFIIKQSTDGAQVNMDWGLGTDLVVPGDYDGDGKADLAVLRQGVRQTDPLTWIIRRSIDGTAFIVNLGTTGTDYNAQNDYDGDGKTDVTVWNNSTATFTVLRSSTLTNSTQLLGAPNDYPVASYDTH